MKSADANAVKVVSAFVEANCGIVIDNTKAYLVESRLGPLLQAAGVADYKQLVDKASRPGGDQLKRKVIDAITTNETYFFRDEKPFELLKYKLIPDCFEKQMDRSTAKPSMRIWSAAASTGQEIYSIAIIIKELLGSFDGYDVRLLGTDISEASLELASRGMYGKVELSRGLSGARLKNNFHPNDPLWQINDDLRALASFRPLNLLGNTLPIPKQDIIFCRNVAFYFSKKNKNKLYRNLAKQLQPGGRLIIGITETLLGIDAPFEKRDFRGIVYYERV